MPNRDELEEFKRNHAFDLIAAQNAYLILKRHPNASLATIRRAVEEHVDVRIYHEIVLKHFGNEENQEDDK